MSRLYPWLMVLALVAPLQHSFADAYLKSLEERIAALEAEVNTTNADVKGKGEVAAPKIPVYVVPKSKYVQELKLRGRLQTQYGYSWGDGYQNPGSGNYSTFEIRRARIGVEGRIADDYKFVVEIEVAGGPGVGLIEAYVAYDGIKYFQPKAGKYKPRFGYEEYMSDPLTLTVERSRITNAFATGQIVGASLEGKFEMVDWSFGIFNALPGGGSNPLGDVELTGFSEQNYLYNASVGVTFKELVGFPLEFRLDYMSFSTDPITDQPNRLNLKQNFNLSMNAEWERFRLIIEGFYGFDSNAASANLVKSGSGDEYIWAITVEPSVFIIPDHLQYVFRYEYGGAGYITTGLPSAGNGGQPLATRVRYENRLPGAGAGALEYWAIYNGINWLIAGDDLKFMLGHYYSEQKGQPGGSKDGNRVAQTVYGAVRLQF